MRNNTLTVFFVLFFVTTSACLAAVDGYHLKNSAIGLKVGTTYPLTITESFSTIPVFPPSDPDFGFTCGIYYSYYFVKEILAVQAEFNYVLIKATGKLTGLDMYGNPYPPLRNSWHIAQIPLLLKLSAPLESPFKPFITAGPALDLRVYCDLPYNLTVQRSEIIARGTLVAGAGVEYVFERGNAVNIEFRANWKVLGYTAGLIGALPYTFLTLMAGYSI